MSNDINMFRKPPQTALTLNDEDAIFVIHSPEHPVLSASRREFRKHYHSSILFLPSVEGSMPSMDVPISIHIPENLAPLNITISKKFKLINDNDDNQEEVLIVGERTVTRDWDVCSLKEWFVHMEEELESNPSEFFCPRSLRIIEDDTLTTLSYFFEYSPHRDGQATRSRLFSLPIFNFLTGATEYTPEEKEELGFN